MKNRFVFLSILLTLFAGCQKDQSTVVPLAGNWELRISVNGLTGQQTLHPSGKGNLLKFTGDTYQSYSNGKLISDGEYQIVRDTSILRNKTMDRIIFNREYDSIRTFIEIKGKELIIFIDAFDGPSTIYKKQLP